MEKIKIKYVDKTFVEYSKSKWFGRVDGIFRNSFNIVTKDDLIHVHSSLEGLTSLGIVLENLPLDPIDRGDIVLCEDFYLCIYGKELLKFSFQEAKVMDFSLGQLSKEQIFFLKEGLDEDFLRSKIGLEDTDQFRQSCQWLKDPHQRDRALRYFIGRGPGLTPSGDDILCGFLLGKIMEGEEVNRYAFQKAADRMGRVSHAHLKALLKKQGNYLIDKLYQAAKNKNPAEITSAMEAFLGYGHTSGGDFLYGLFLSL